MTRDRRASSHVQILPFRQTSLPTRLALGRLRKVPRSRNLSPRTLTSPRSMIGPLTSGIIHATVCFDTWDMVAWAMSSWRNTG
jgi:hypothetical protein